MSDDPDEPGARLQSGMMRLGMRGKNAWHGKEVREVLLGVSALVIHSKRLNVVLNVAWPVRGGFRISSASCMGGRLMPGRSPIHPTV
ncbi:MAG: hypothetical protein FWH25_01600 [Syntrophorhabdaceae bacterium]|nr:hypothetical protein [Syntrophorhabdaceae bacterium]